MNINPTTNNFKKGDIVELVEDTAFYKKGTKSIIINENSLGNSKKCEIQYVGEKYIDNDVDVIPKELLKLSDEQRVSVVENS